MEITDESIKRVEKILLPDGATFDDINNERKQVIKSIEESIDIQASPGSGKTTTLLAKLILLTEKMPFQDGRGICVLTHTNVAIDELRVKTDGQIDHLFSYPNHFGTFQTFVNKFLAIPYFIFQIGERPNRIDKDYYDDKANNHAWNARFTPFINKKAFHFLNAFDINISEICYNRSESGELILTKGLLGNKVEVRTPWNAQNEWGDDLKSTIENWLFQFKKKMMLDFKILNFDDAYFLAEEYLSKFPRIKKAFSKRFKYVFVDEMQDTYSHQYQLLDQLFNDSVHIQKFGDPHQSIFNYVSLNKVWEPGEDTLTISTSKRFGESIANILRTVCIEPNTDLQGNEDVTSCSPHIIIYDENTVEKVLDRFIELIYELDIVETLKETNRPIKAIGWVGPDPNNEEKCTIKTYCNNYRRKLKKDETIKPSVKSYLGKKSTNKAKEYFDSIVNCFLLVLEFADRKRETETGRRAYTKNTLLNELKEKDEGFYRNFKKNISEWIHQIINSTNNYSNNVLEEVKFYIRNDFSDYFSIEIDGNLEKFIESDELLEDTNEVMRGNLYLHSNEEFDEIKIEVGTIHSAKGETHSATLYLETDFYAQRESQRIITQLTGSVYNNLDINEDKRRKLSLKMAYVGMSRPSHLLCFAGHKENIIPNRDELEENGWVLVDDMI